MKAIRVKPTLLIFVLGIAVFIVSMVAVSYGSTDVSFQEVWQYLLIKIGYLPEDYLSKTVQDVISLIRLPRVIAAVLVGIGLSYAGTVMQALVRNPVADPYTLGISSGAYLGAVLAIMLGFGKSQFGSEAIGISAFLGALLIAILVLVIAQIGGRSNTMKLLLTGMAVSSASQAIANFIVFLANDREGMRTVTFWTMGSLGGVNWESNRLLFIIVISGFVFFALFHRLLDLMLLGDEQALTLGVDLGKYRIMCILIVSIVVGFIVNASGIIGFIGLIIPHFARMLVGTNHKYLLPVSSLLGSIVLVLADVLSRTLISHTEIPIGILISLIGAPVFVYILIRHTYKEGVQ
ncbi:ABC transporter [Suicoccus acidiformans]|uniref:ABC transporter n=1 Tax=Suicoccus acidiformans TaxID=2036206 RepID=A0A347WM00_9LACT|nr:iron ABC transporter permease [Suicoccus acidiformans]AXY26107.1 ABC transporter [Suicoccus acidiformans]